MAPDRTSADVEFWSPDYENRSISDVVPAVAAALGVGPEAVGVPPTGLPLPPATAYVVFLVDGLGFEQLRAHADDAPFLSEHLGRHVPATAGVPSTTATSLTSLGTALPPGAHGVVGFTSRVPGTNRLLNALTWDRRVDPIDWQPHPTAFGRLASAGVAVTVVNKREFRDSGLTVAAQRGAEYVGADRVGERIAAAVASSGRQPSLTYLYDGDLDWTGHRFGVASHQWRQQLTFIDSEVEQLRDSLPGHARLLIVADHGMIDSPPDHRIDVDVELALRDGVHLLGGEARFRHLYCRGGAVEDVVATWRQTLGQRALVLARDEALERGWFGATAPSVRPRLGDVVVASRGDHAVVSSADFPYETTLVGLHGSLTPAEMLIPMIVI